MSDLTLEEIEALEPTFIGPTWQHDEDGQWLLPKWTLGWQIAAWCAENLNALGGNEGPFQFTLEQLRFLLWWYAIDERGQFVYRTGVLQRLKGWGKDPLLAVISLVELCGPCRFDKWGPDGQPVGKSNPDAWVVICAVNQSQTTNTVGLFPALVSPQMEAKYGIKIAAEITRANGGRQRLEAVTSSYRAMEGKRPTFTLLNETHHWVEGNQGHQMFETIDGNATKIAKSRYLAITNAFVPGEDSVAERAREAYDKIASGRAIDVGILYDSIEAHEATPLTAEALRIVLPKIRGDAYWLEIDPIIQSIQNSQIGASRSRRMFLNQIVASEDALYGPDQWRALEDENLILRTGDEIVLGFDGGKTDDSTALVAIRISDGAVFVRCLEERDDKLPSDAYWEVNREKVDSAVHETFRLHKVKAFYADVALWESYIDDWAELYRETLAIKATGNHAIAWDMRRSAKLVTQAHERLVMAILDGRLKHDGNLDLKRHVLNVRRRENNYGVGFGKESRESRKKIDLYAALMLAHEALHDLRTRGAKPERERSGKVFFF